MEGLDAEIAVYMAMEHGDVAVAHHPFRTLSEACEIKAVNYADGAVAAPCTEDGTDCGIVQLLLEGEGTDSIIAGKLVVGVEKVGRQHYVELPRAEEGYSRVNFVTGYFACWCYDGNTVAWLKVRWTYHACNNEDGSGILCGEKCYFLHFNF